MRARSGCRSRTPRRSSRSSTAGRTSSGRSSGPAFEEWRAARTSRTSGGSGSRRSTGRSAPRRPQARARGDRRLGARADPPRSVLLVGSTVSGRPPSRAALDRLASEPTVFETTAQLNAGAIYIGELEGRVKTLVESVAGQDVVWVLPELQETLFAGSTCVARRGCWTRCCRTSSPGRSRSSRRRRRPRSSFSSRRDRGSRAPSRSCACARSTKQTRCGGEHASSRECSRSRPTTRRSASRSSWPSSSCPGSRRPGTCSDSSPRRLPRPPSRVRSAGADVLATLAAGPGPARPARSGGPAPAREVRAFFERRVLEQPEAVDCVVERIAMIKAGVTDTARWGLPLRRADRHGQDRDREVARRVPLRVARAARPPRHGEYQTPESLRRLLSDTTHEQRGAALVSSVRKDPFAVVLLDEFEKAAQPIWDLFLQVFDDGRLTDLQGRVVDFRRCVIVLTSNIGSPLARGRASGSSPPRARSRAPGSSARSRARSGRVP